MAIPCLSDATRQGISAFLPTAAAGTAIIDFGTAGASDASVTVTGQAGIKATSIVLVGLAAVATSDHTADEHCAEDMMLRASAPTVATGFTIRATTKTVPLRGKWTVSWVWI